MVLTGRGIAAVLAAVAATAALAPAAGASEPVAHAARFPSSVAVDVAPGGNATVVSPTLPPGAKQGTIAVKPARSADDDLFANLTEVLAAAPSRGVRVLTCIVIALGALDPEDMAVAFNERDKSLQLLFLHACLRIALARAPGAGSRAAAATTTPCRRADRAVGIRVTRASGGYRAHVEGTPRRASRRSRLVTSCRRSGTGLRITMRPRSRRRTLRQVVGPTIGIGLVSPADAARSVRVRTTFAVR